MKKVYTAAFKAQVALELLKEEKTLSQISAEYGVHPNILREWKTQALKVSPHSLSAAMIWRHQGRSRPASGGSLRGDRPPHHPTELVEKKAATLPYRVRRALIEQPAEPLPLRTQAALLSISRTHLYYQPAPPSAREVAIKHRIDELFTACPFYGSRKLQALLEVEFGPIARNTVRHYMQEMGLTAIYPGPNLSKRHPDQRLYRYLLRHVTAAHPNHVWGVDITYIRLRSGWMYLVAILDWFARYVVSWALSDTLPWSKSACRRSTIRPQGVHLTRREYVADIAIDATDQCQHHARVDRALQHLAGQGRLGCKCLLGGDTGAATALAIQG